ncbi:MAG: 16S rRNA processing protein RimM [Chloroflexi bacterium]|nr:MAG: 16S rRNA processing protein RimM [Chloroflexota bacterium]
MQQPKSKPAGRSGQRFETYTHRNRKVRVPLGYMAVGLITGAHGLRGELRVEVHSDNPARFAVGSRLWLGEGLDGVEILTSRPHKGQVLLTLSGIDSRADADAVRGEWLFIPDQDAAELDEDTYYVHDIIGAAVQTQDGRPLGVVKDILFTGANEVYIVTPPDAPEREILLPAIADVILQVDVEQGLITVNLLPGLLEE